MTRSAGARIAAVLAALSLVVLTAAAGPAAPRPSVTVYKSPTCGCCKAWMDHLRASGFDVKGVDISNAQLDEMRASLGVSQRLSSCHTAVIDNKVVVEGHVPAAAIKRFMQDKPAAVGLAAPGMPIGSPGMEQGDQKDRYDVVAFDRNGKVTVYATYVGSQEVRR